MSDIRPHERLAYGEIDVIASILLNGYDSILGVYRAYFRDRLLGSSIRNAVYTVVGLLGKGTKEWNATFDTVIGEGISKMVLLKSSHCPGPSSAAVLTGNPRNDSVPIQATSIFDKLRKTLVPASGC